MQGRVVDKYLLNNGNLGMIVQDKATHRRYHVEFRDNYKGHGADNLFGLLKEPFGGKAGYLDKLVKEGDDIDLTLSYSRGPFREACYVHSVLSSNAGNTSYESSRKLIDLPYRAR